MNILTVGVGQGAMSIIRHANEAIIVDCRIPPRDDETVAIVKEILAVSLKDHFVKGLILTGFDDDHTDIVGASIILRKYRPDWVMYPTYYKDTREAERVFALIDEEEKLRAGSAAPLRRHSVRLDQLAKRVLPGLSDNFDFELFSPHIEDMDCSNNCSIVVKVIGRGPRGFSYLVTGDTENPRWDTIERLFGNTLKSHVMAAPHHGSRNACHPAALMRIAPHTVLISAGVESQYGHPNPNAVRVYKRVAKYVYSTNMGGGVSLLTQPGTAEITTTLIPSAQPEVAGSSAEAWRG
jgi:beta-lactamase superfamily II metal-dependent hydrolase